MLETRQNTAQQVIECWVPCGGTCMFPPVYPVVCACLHECRTHFNLFIHFTWQAVAAACMHVGEEDYRKMPILLQILFSPSPLIDKNLKEPYHDNRFINIPACITHKQHKQLHTQRSRDTSFIMSEPHQELILANYKMGEGWKKRSKIGQGHHFSPLR